MRIVRFQDGSDLISFGWVYEGQVGRLKGDIFTEYQRLETKYQTTKEEAQVNRIMSSLIYSF